jgi:hypothetical protein
MGGIPMERHIMVVQVNPVVGRDDEFNEWYDNYHIKEMLKTPGFVSARRFRFCDVQLPSGDTASHKYLVIYEIEGAIAPVVADLMSPETAKRITPSTAFDSSNAVLRLFTAVGPVMT